MVLHRGNNLLQRDIYPPREQPTWPGDRNFSRTYNNENLNPARFNPETSIHGRSVPIGTALGECAGLDQKEFALIVQQSNGEFKTYTSPALRDLQDRIFSTRFQQNFQSIVRQASGVEVYGLDSGSGFNDYDGEANGLDHRKQSSAGASDGSSSGSRKRRKAQNAKSSDDEGSGSSSRKRRWGRYAQVDHEDDTPQPMQTVKNQMLRIGDDEEVHNLYHTRFKDMQQAACKVMGKAFVKLIEPKKQTHHPYTKGDEKRPPWWPPTTGDNHVRHKEPDHLLKPERIRLLTHILEMVIEPYHKQHPTVQKLGLNVSKLQDVTMEAMNNWFNDKEHTANAAKKPFLKEIFRVAKVQERYKNGEIDDTTKVSVMSADCTGGSSSDDEPDDGDAYDEAENTSPLIPSPDSIVSASGTSMMQNIQPGPRPMDDSRAREIDLVNRQRHDWRPTQRYHTQSQMDDQNSSFQNDSFRQQKWELNSAGPSFHQPPPDPSHHGQFQAPQQQQSIYGWQNTSMPIIGGSTNGPSPQPFYGTSPQSSNGPGSYQLPPLPTNNPLPPQSMPPPLALNHSGYNDGLPAGGTRYDTGPATLGTQMRTGSLGHPYGPRDHQGSGGYSDFLNEHGAFNHADDSIKDDQHHLHPQ